MLTYRKFVSCIVRHCMTLRTTNLSVFFNTIPSVSGGFVPRLPPGLRPWTPLVDFRPPDPLVAPTQSNTSEWASSIFIRIHRFGTPHITVRDNAKLRKPRKKYLRILVSIGLASGVVQRRSARPPRCRLSVGPWTLAVYTDEKRLEAAKNAEIWRALIGAESNTLTLRVDRVVSLFLVSKRSCV